MGDQVLVHSSLPLNRGPDFGFWCLCSQPKWKSLFLSPLPDRTWLPGFLMGEWCGSLAQWDLNRGCLGEKKAQFGLDCCLLPGGPAQPPSPSYLEYSGGGSSLCISSKRQSISLDLQASGASGGSGWLLRYLLNGNQGGETAHISTQPSAKCCLLCWKQLLVVQTERLGVGRAAKDGGSRVGDCLGLRTNHQPEGVSLSVPRFTALYSPILADPSPPPRIVLSIKIHLQKLERWLSG